MDEPISFGYWVRRRRRALDLTSEELARQIGCAGVTIRKIEADERRPSRQIAERLAVCLEVPEADRPAFLKAARAELAVDRLATPPEPPISPPSPRQRGDRAPRQQALKGYELRQQIGAGGFGAVYRAVQPGIEREVAVKIILPEYADHPDFIRRFEAEAQLVVRLEHPHIVPLYDYWRESGGAYLVMRYIRGGSLQTALNNGAWELQRCTQLLDQIGAALAFAHRQGVVHRDIKPANVLLDEESNAYLADFGIAKDLRMANAVSETQPGAIVGSPDYLSPEQIRDEPITPQTDIYSLGVLLYEILTGMQPFSNLSPAERLYQQLHTPLPPLAPELPAALNEIIQRATAKAPADRFPDVGSMLAAWQRAVTTDHRPPTTDKPTIAVAPSPSVPRPSSDLVTLTDLARLENPYKGLRAFGEADAADFFGRAALTQRLLERMAEADALTPRPPLPAAGEGEILLPFPPTAGEGEILLPFPPTWGKGLGDGGRFLAVVGPSGSGKSSVVRAGLIPALRRGGLPGSEQWFVIEMLPGAHPLEELEAALLRVAVNPPPSLLEQLSTDERGLVRAVKRALPADTRTELVLVIDQFEEIFTLVEDATVRTHFLDSIRAAILDPHSRLRVLVTLRADFYDRPLGYAGFGELMRERTEVVLPLTPEEIEQAIAGPAARVGVTPAPELIATMIKEVGEQPGTLPLLQYALTELFERREGLALTLAAYRDSGGVHGALARRADEIYAALDAKRQEAARQLFLRLITLGEGVEDTRRRVLRSELSALTNDQTEDRERAPAGSTENQPGGDGSQFLVLGSDPSSAMNAVIERYGRARLLTFDRDQITRGPTVEVAHEALLREWGRLRAWLEASRADVRMQRMLAAAAGEWSAAGREPSYLLGGARLAQFAGWSAQTDVALTQDERAFLDASIAENAQREAAEQTRQARELETARQLAATEQRRADEQSRAATRLRRRAIFLAGALVLALVAAIAAGVFARTAQNNFTRAESLRLITEANSALDRGESGDLPALLALRSIQYGGSPQVGNVLRRALARPFTVQRFIGHTGPVYGVAFSPDGRQVLTGSDDHTARLWDMQTGRQLRVFTGNAGQIRSVAFSPDGKVVATGSQDGIVQLWDTQTGAELRHFRGHSDLVSGVAFSPDSRYVVTASKDATAQVWDAASGKQLHIFGHSDWVNNAVFSPDGKIVATSSDDHTARLWDAQTSHQLRSFVSGPPFAGVNRVAFSPDGRYVLAGYTEDKTARLWDATTGKQLRVFTGHTDGVISVAFSPDGKYVLTGSADETARLWDAQTSQQLYIFSGHTGVVDDVAFSPDGKYVLTGSTDGTARLWDALPATEPLSFIGHTDEVHAVAFSPDGKYVLTGSGDKTARLWDARTGQQLHVLTGHTDIIWSVAFSPDSKYALTGGDDGDPTARLWDAQTGQQLHVFQHGRWVSGMAISPDGRYMFTGSGDNFVRLWDVATGQEIRRFGPPAEVDAIAVSPDGKYVVTGGDDKTARLWDAETGQQLRTFTGHTATIWSVAFSPDGKRVLTSGDTGDDTARLWDAQTGQQLRVFSGQSSGIRRVAFSPDGKQVLTGSFDGTARLWDVATGQQLHILRGHVGALFGVAFSPDGKQVLTASGDKTALLWHLDDQDLIRIACATLPRDLTAEERATYSIADDAPTCPKP